MKLLKLSLVTALVVLTFYLLIVGQALLLPLVIAVVFWYLINLLSRAFRRISLGGYSVPEWGCSTLSVLSFVGIIWAVVELISMNIDGVVQVAPVYQANFENRVESLLTLFGIQVQEGDSPLAQLTEIINIREIIAALAGALTSVAANSGVIIIYMLFLFLEQGNLDKKISALFKDTHREKRFRRLLRKIQEDVSKYIGIKMFTSTLTGVFSYIFLKIVGVDFSEFWAVLIFLLNFIPTIGSIIATVFPSLITLVQFDTLTPFFLVVGGVTTIQICIGNVLEPRLMGNSLNLSPMIILLNLSLWGIIWGIPGMFLCVPLLVICMIIFSHIPQTWPIAVMLSRDGQVSMIQDDAEQATGMGRADQVR